MGRRDAVGVAWHHRHACSFVRSFIQPAITTVVSTVARHIMGEAGGQRRRKKKAFECLLAFRAVIGTCSCAVYGEDWT